MATTHHRSCGDPNTIDTGRAARTERTTNAAWLPGVTAPQPLSWTRIGGDVDWLVGVLP
ncbi:hypothetical protein Pme01_28390 [Planosporangium mesophilum]|uniref:Uncharacterized protein n=1 Tax=Planosporangium mesophilum TaxID=689768 RepID=A0A8J3X0F2_9ACTN|nr:hypothetical protein Pme01_28390 [Planosporangium mesophilum]